MIDFKEDLRIIGHLRIPPKQEQDAYNRLMELVRELRKGGFTLFINEIDINQIDIYAQKITEAVS